MIRVRDRPRFTVDEMAREFEVSRRTMLRDLQALSEMGVPLSAVPGPGGGYSLVASARMPPLSLSVDEAVSIVLSYESFLQYADSPFAEQSISAITKLRNAMPADVVRQLDELRAHVAVLGQERVYRAPFLGQLLAASIEHVHLSIGYESRSRTADRLVFPIGLYASEGFWYLACHDQDRGEVVGLRADRVRSVERVAEREPPTDLTLRGYLATYRSGARDLVRLRARVGRGAAFSFDFNSMFGGAMTGAEPNVLDSLIPRTDIGWFADHILPLGPDFVVEEPAELIAEIRGRARGIAALYGG
jgi:predicted DNA-binding transcriptional regulator YafY